MYLRFAKKMKINLSKVDYIGIFNIVHWSRSNQKWKFNSRETSGGWPGAYIHNNNVQHTLLSSDIFSLKGKDDFIPVKDIIQAHCALGKMQPMAAD